MKKLSVIIVSFNTSDILRRCLTALFSTPVSHELEVFVVDNDSHDDSVAMLTEEFPGAELIANDQNRGFAAACNQAYHRATGDYVIHLNPDASITTGAIDNAIDFMEDHPDAALCGPALDFPVRPRSALG